MQTFPHLQNTVDQLISSGELSHIAVRIVKNGEILGNVYRGADEKTLFDMASVTKIVVIGDLLLIALDRNLVSLDDPVSKYFPVPQDKENITLLHLVTHSFGIGHKALNLPTVNYDNVWKEILKTPLDYAIGTEVRYSCSGYILLGKILEKVFGKRIDVLFDEMVAQKLGMNDSGFLPAERKNIVNSNLSDDELGFVNDYNCRHLGGIAGNAGLFSNVSDMTKYVKMLENRGAPLFSEAIFEKALRNYTPGKKEWRGLGFMLVDPTYIQTGRLFPAGTPGHCGHTGQSVFYDPTSGLSVLILSDLTRSNRLKNGKEIYSKVKALRGVLHDAIADDLGL